MSEPNIQEFLRKEIKPKAEELLKTHAKERDKLQTLLFALESEVEKKNERMIRQHVKTLELVVADLASRLSRTSRLLEKLEELKPDQNFLKEQKTIEALTAALSDLERKLTRNYGIAKNELDKANDALEADEAEMDSTEATHEWAIMEAWLRKQLDGAKKRLDQMAQLRETARKAMAARDEKDLAAAIKASTALADAKPTLEEVQEYYETFCTKCAAKLNKNQQDQFARDRDAFDAMMRELLAAHGKMLATDVEIGAMEIQPVDVKKAAALLDIPSSHEAKLKKALGCQGAAMLKLLDALAKELKMKTTGKDLLATLKKAKLPGI